MRPKSKTDQSRFQIRGSKQASTPYPPVIIKVAEPARPHPFVLPQITIPSRCALQSFLAYLDSGLWMGDTGRLWRKPAPRRGRLISGWPLNVLPDDLAQVVRVLLDDLSSERGGLVVGACLLRLGFSGAGFMPPTVGRNQKGPLICIKGTQTLPPIEVALLQRLVSVDQPLQLP